MDMKLLLSENVFDNSSEMFPSGNFTDLLTDPLNVTDSAQTPHDMTKTQFMRYQRLLWNAQLYLTPVIIIVGLFGNIMSFLVFVMTSLLHLSSSVYLAALALADSGFLFQVFLNNKTSIFL